MRALFGLGRFEEALSLAEKTIQGYDKFYNEIHYQRYEELVLILKCHIALKQREKAQELYKYVFSIGEKLFVAESKQLKNLRLIFDETSF